MPDLVTSIGTGAEASNCPDETWRGRLYTSTARFAAADDNYPFGMPSDALEQGKAQC